MSPDSAINVSPVATLDRPSAVPVGVEHEVLALFDQWGPSLLRYVGSFRLSPEEAEDIVQEVFLALLRHLQLGRSRQHLRGWIFQVAHNLALKQRKRVQTRSTRDAWDEPVLAGLTDTSMDPEARLLLVRRRARIDTVLRELPLRDRQCVLLRAEGLRYREIAIALRLSLGGVAKALARAFATILDADER